jgi:hypothetical protein
VIYDNNLIHINNNQIMLILIFKARVNQVKQIVLILKSLMNFLFKVIKIYKKNILEMDIKNLTQRPNQTKIENNHI